MLPNERALAEKNSALFEQYRQEALQRASALVTERARTRDVDTPIWAKMPFGLKSFVTFVHHKACRLASNVRALDEMLWSKHKLGSPEDIAKLEATIDDELLDSINYNSFAWAYRRLQAQQKTICIKETFGEDAIRELASCLRPKCKAERAESEATRKMVRRGYDTLHKG